MPPTNETQHRTPWQIAWQRTPLKFARKVISRNWEHELKRNPKFIRGKSAQSKLGKKKTLLRFIWLGLSCDFSLLGRLMKTLISRHFAKYVTNFLLLCSVRRFVNKICKSRSQTKAREEGQHSAGGLPIMTPFALGYRFPKTLFQPCKILYIRFCIFLANNTLFAELPKRWIWGDQIRMCGGYWWMWSYNLQLQA